MIIKNFIWYVLNKPLPAAGDIGDLLAKNEFESCLPQQQNSQGWVAPLRKGDFVYGAHGAQLLMLKQERRLLPSSVISEYLQYKVEEFEAAEGYAPSRKIRQQMKEDLTLELLPKAFTKSLCIPVLIFPRQGWLFVLSSSSNAADNATAFLRETLGSLPISMVGTDLSPGHIMTNWLGNSDLVPQDWALGEEAELKENEAGTVKVRNQDLLSEELAAHLDAGKLVNKLSLIWREDISLILNDDLTIKRIKLLLEDDDAPSSGDPQDAKFAHEFAVSCNWMVPFCESLLSAMGGLNKALASSIAKA
ncbi:MAG: recombination-associated protein RdgC [Bermanella sp.]